MKSKLYFALGIALLCLTLLPLSAQPQNQPPDIIETIEPDGAEAGSGDLAVTIYLKNMSSPPLPPSRVMPSGVTIGVLEGYNITRDGHVITARFDIPADEENGFKDVVLAFPGPANNRIEFFKACAFEVRGEQDGGTDDGIYDDPVDIVPSARDYVIVDTGQEAFYDNSREISAPSAGESFYGQDAHYRGLQPSYRDNGDGTVTDLNTGLMWQQGLPAGKYPYSDCVAYADSCILAGYSDWRLPTIKELFSLMLFSGMTGRSAESSIPYIDTGVFDFRYGGEVNSRERFIDSQYATSTIYTGTTMGGNETMFGLNLADGRIKGYPTSKDFEIKLVRGANNYGVNEFIDNADGTITDLATGLMWDQYGSDRGMNWEEALAWAEQKNDENYLGYSDWRLPNAKELQSIVHYERSPSYTNSAAISPLFDVPVIRDEKGGDNYPYYWTSTTHYDGQGPTKAVYIAFGEALGYMHGQWIDVHGAGAQRSDPKSGNPADYAGGFGPQGDAIRIDNYVRLVRIGEQTTGQRERDAGQPKPFRFGNYPNPFNPSTAISFSLPAATYVEVSIFNLRGQLVKTLISRDLIAGNHRVSWDGTDQSGRRVASGSYICHMIAGDQREQSMLTLMK
jgi:hypothetical protein